MSSTDPPSEETAPPPVTSWRERATTTRGVLLVGVTFTKSFDVWRRALPWLLVVVGIVHAPVAAFDWWWRQRHVSELENIDPDVVFAQVRPLLLAPLVWLVAGYVVQGIVVQLVVQARRHEPLSLGTALRAGLARLPVIAGVGVVQSLLLGSFSAVPLLLLSMDDSLVFLAPLVFLLVIPATAWYLSIAVASVERVSVFGALRRSARLTKGSRWRIVGLFVVQALIGGAVALPLSLIEWDSESAGYFAEQVATAVATTLSAVIPVVAYQELRKAKEGIDLDQLAEVFA